MIKLQECSSWTTKRARSKNIMQIIGTLRKSDNISLIAPRETGENWKTNLRFKNCFRNTCLRPWKKLQNFHYSILFVWDCLSYDITRALRYSSILPKLLKASVVGVGEFHSFPRRYKNVITIGCCSSLEEWQVATTTSIGV